MTTRKSWRREIDLTFFEGNSFGVCVEVAVDGTSNIHKCRLLVKIKLVDVRNEEGNFFSREMLKEKFNYRESIKRVIISWISCSSVHFELPWKIYRCCFPIPLHSWHVNVLQNFFDPFLASDKLAKLLS